MASMLALVVALACPLAAHSEGFLGGHAHGEWHDVQHTAGGEARSHQLQDAIGAVLGCAAGRCHGDRLVDIERAILPIWQVLPRSAHERIEWRWVRYTAHRYFTKQSSLMIRGFEPMRKVNESHAGEAEILRQQAPALVEMVLEGHRSSAGFSLQDVVALVATLEQLVLTSESALLEKVYGEHGPQPGQSLAGGKLQEILETYMVRWIMGDDEEGIQMVLENRTELAETIPHWAEIALLVEGTVKGIEYERQHSPRRGGGRAALSSSFSFDDAHHAVGTIARSFASFWETTCQDIKASLVSLDKEGTGRVPLSDFYGANTNGEWRFGESEAYLRELGALDESSPWRGKQVIIPNYLQAASNCIVSREHYLVCCANECEDTLNDVEAAVGGPLANASHILSIVGNMTSYDDEPARVTQELGEQLRRVAASSGGLVPLHGRLFAQWLHYVFPRECPFPHKMGTASAVTPLQFGESYLVTEEEMDMHVKDGHVRAALSDARGETMERNAEPWMSQWSEEEELIGDYALQLHAPWEGDRSLRLAFGGAVALAVGLVLAVLKVASPVSIESKGGAVFHAGVDSRTHFV